MKSEKTEKTEKSNLIPARPNFLGELLVYWICRRSLYRAFNAIHFRAAQPLPAPPSQLDAPIIFYANHPTWWDGYLAHLILRQVYGLEPRLMMDLKQLRRYRFFSWAGCFSVDRENGREALRSIEYISREMHHKPGMGLWIFPQGVIVSQDKRPLDFYTGLAYIIKKVENCYVYPVSTRFEFTREQFPEIFVNVGPVQQFKAGNKINTRELTVELEAALTRDLDQLKMEVTTGEPGNFIRILRGRSSTDKKLDKILA